MTRQSRGLYYDSHAQLLHSVEAADVAVVTAAGELDVSNAGRLREEIEHVLERRRDLILDVSEVTSLDSSVLGALLEAHRSANARARRVVLQVGEAHIVDRILALTGVDRVIPRAQTRADALSALHER